MKNFLIAALCLLIFFSCSRKTVPPKLNNVTFDTSSSAKPGTVVPADSIAKADSVNAVSANAVLVIADGYGRLITSQQNLPAGTAVNYNSLELSKGFTTQQRANLQARYKTVPPRVLFVPAEKVSTSLKGSYYILKKKFWYWKKSDGLFYLDQKYYL